MLITFIETVDDTTVEKRYVFPFRSFSFLFFYYPRGEAEEVEEDAYIAIGNCLCSACFTDCYITTKPQIPFFSNVCPLLVG